MCAGKERIAFSSLSHLKWALAPCCENDFNAIFILGKVYLGLCYLYNALPIPSEQKKNLLIFVQSQRVVVVADCFD